MKRGWNLRQLGLLVATGPLLATLLYPGALAIAQEQTIDVYVASGRVFQGQIDPASTSEHLILRSDSASIAIRRPIRWERVVSVSSAAGEQLDVDQLRQDATGTSGSSAPPLAAGTIRLTAAATSSSPTIRLPSISETAKPLETIHSPPPVRPVSITFDARIANWDGDVESDGLLVDLAPLDAAGHVSPASGTLQVELLAPQRRVFHHAPRSGGDTLEIVERWQRVVQLADFGPHGVRLKLPFGAVHPELDHEWFAWSYGLVHVRFASAGSVVLEDSIDGVRLRSWAPNRDQLELNEGRRFWPTEGLGRRD